MTVDLPHCVVQDCIPFGAAAQKGWGLGELGLEGGGKGGVRRGRGGGKNIYKSQFFLFF